MDAERYAKVRALFLAVEELPTEQHRDYLRQQCGDDPTLVDEVLSLLDEHDVDSAMLEGNSAKHPVLPPSQTASSPTLSPFMPESGAIEQRVASGESSGRTQRQFNRRKRELPSKSGSAKSKHGRSETDSSGERVSKDRGDIAQVTMQGAQRTHASPRYQDEAAPPRRPPSPGLWQSKVRRHRRFNSGWLFLAAILPTILVGAWTYSTVVKSLRGSTANELAGVADNVQLNVQRFLDDQANLAKSWSQQDDLRRAIVELVQSDWSDADSNRLKNNPVASRIQSQLQSLSRRSSVRYSVWDRTGRVIAASDERSDMIGTQVPPGGAGYLARAIHGDTVLFGPGTLEPLLGEDTALSSEPVMAELLPILDDESNVVATILIHGFGMFESFDQIFRQASLAGGQDIYAVDVSGTMVSNSALAVERLLASDSNVSDAGGQARRMVACRLRVCDPGETKARDQLATKLRRRQPLTYAVFGVSNGDNGSMLTPYPNYAGDSVVGAWRWIEQYQIGVVVERSSDLAFQTARIVRYGFITLGCMLTLTAFLAASMIAKRTAIAQAAVHPLSRYQIVSELGSGGMGVVYRAKHSQLGRETALKVLRADRDNLEDRLRFDREAKLASSLSNAHTVTIYDYGRGEEGEAYCVMEYLQGITLYDVVARSGIQDIGRVLFILRQICDSLGEAHHLGLVHRDMKPQNVMMSMDSSVGDWAVVFDFGLAKPLHPASNSYQTTETIWAGTPMYMAPERYREPNKIDPRSDLYSVGCIAYFLLSGRPPFIECDPESLFALVLTEQPISISVHRDEEIPEEVTAFVRRCMAKSVDDRFGSVDELAKHLDQLIPKYPWTVEQARTWWRIHGDELD